MILIIHYAAGLKPKVRIALIEQTTATATTRCNTAKSDLDLRSQLNSRHRHTHSLHLVRSFLINNGNKLCYWFSFFVKTRIFNSKMILMYLVLISCCVGARPLNCIPREKRKLISITSHVLLLLFGSLSILNKIDHYRAHSWLLILIVSGGGWMRVIWCPNLPRGTLKRVKFLYFSAHLFMTCYERWPQISRLTIPSQPSLSFMLLFC